MSLLHPVLQVPEDDPLKELCSGLVDIAPDDYAAQDTLIQGELAALRRVIFTKDVSSEIMTVNVHYYVLYMRTLLARRIIALNLEPKQINPLFKTSDVEVTTIGSILNYTSNQLRSVRNFGDKSIKDLTDELARYGLELQPNAPTES